MAAEIADHYDAPVRIAIIGGTGLSALPSLPQVATLNPTTPWGAPSSPLTIHHHTPPSAPTGSTPTPVAFLARHGQHHQLAPHEIPSRANIAALRHIGVRCIIAFSAVGSLRTAIAPRDFVVPDQVIDRTKGIRPFTFFEDGMVGHVPFADPFLPSLGALVRACGTTSLQGENVRLHEKGTLVCMEGPQFSTRAESHMYRSWGGDVVNMSCLPEAKLAREAEVGYQMVCMSTDYDCWKGDEDVSVEMVMGNMAANAANAGRFLGAVLEALGKEGSEDVVAAKELEGGSRFGGSVTKVEGRGKEAKERLNWLLPGYFE